ncbi:MAG: D-glycero-beta-D-manno-heptose-7-phosphate kinase [Pyrinomonadaceae bacterium]|nr:D-glycero-beta-D-manno-heptose-7-phosphate kinase [Pyrinomonadaceae bacterium]
MSLEINNLLEKFAQVKILIIGDVMLDRYWMGSVTRISPEAPVPVVNLEREILIAGGAANVAANIKGLTATPILVGVVGNDSDGKYFKKVLEKNGINSEYIITVADRPTTVKTRVLAHQQQIARIDQETIDHLPTEIENEISNIAEKLIFETDLLIISDYNKGLLSKELLARLITTGNKFGKKILIDPKGKNYEKYKKGTFITPNQKEAYEATQIEDINSAGNKLLFDLELESLLITQGENGMTLFRKNQTPVHLEALARHVFDVTGAGDTVISTLGVAIAAGAGFLTAAKIANIAAGFVVEEVGTTIIKIDKLRESNI